MDTVIKAELDKMLVQAKAQIIANELTIEALNELSVPGAMANQVVNQQTSLKASNDLTRIYIAKLEKYLKDAATEESK